MSAYKTLNSQDLIVSPFEVNKNFYFVGGESLTGSDVGIARYLGRSGNYLESSSQMTGTINSSQIPTVLVYESIRQLYYGNYVSGSGGFIGDAITSSIVLGSDEAGNERIGPIQNTNFYDYPQTTLWANRDFPTASAATASVPIGVISIPSKLYGDYIQPQSFLIEHNESGSIGDDGEGRLYYNFKNQNNVPVQFMAGNIIYEHGIVTLFDAKLVGVEPNNNYGSSRYGEDIYGPNIIETELFIDAFINSNQVTMSFSSSYKIFETQYQVTLNEDEFNYSTNPTTVTGSTFSTNLTQSQPSLTSSYYGRPLDFATGSYFEPYITTIGLYDNNFNLLAVGKLGKPLQTSATTDTTILVNIDR
tara:strand:+ start:5233 stop:6315 length:1083 start_codon:yes stop_codon:yes gene_type:complete